jgi:hypothetical protein
LSRVALKMQPTTPAATSTAPATSIPENGAVTHHFRLSTLSARVRRV